jgi:hypothetical protein
MAKLREGRATTLGDLTVSVEPEFFTENIFGMGNVNTKSFILMLAQVAPRSFISGAPIDLASKLRESNRTEFHHLMPRSFLKNSGQREPDDSVLANLAFVSRTDNRELGGLAPSRYRPKMIGNVEGILEHELCPTSFGDSYKNCPRASRYPHSERSPAHGVKKLARSCGHRVPLHCFSNTGWMRASRIGRALNIVVNCSASSLMGRRTIRTTIRLPLQNLR